MNRSSHIRTARQLLPAASWLSAALAFLFLTLSCQKSPLDSPQDTPTDTQIPIEFGVADNWTKASLSDLATLQNDGFQVWAWFDGINSGHMFGDTGTAVTYSDIDGVWTYTPTRYWLPGIFNFFAVHPKTTAVDPTGGDFKVSYNLGSQTDLLVANTPDIDGAYPPIDNGVQLYFEHALCQLEFQAQAKPLVTPDTENTYKSVLTGIEIINVVKMATYSSKVGWIIDDNVDKTTYSITKESQNLKVDSPIVYETGIIMIPQNVAGIEIKITAHGSAPLYGTIPVPEGGKWQGNKKYTYLILVDQYANITFAAPVVTDWIRTNGSSFVIDTNPTNSVNEQ